MSTSKRNLWLMAGALVMIALVGFVDAKSSAYVAFSIFYILPIAAVSWVIGRGAGLEEGAGARGRDGRHGDPPDELASRELVVEQALAHAGIARLDHVRDVVPPEAAR